MFSLSLQNIQEMKNWTATALNKSSDFYSRLYETLSQQTTPVYDAFILKWIERIEIFEFVRVSVS